jgi:hypothetical protein
MNVLLNLKFLKRSTSDQLDRIPRQVEPHESLCILPSFRGNFPHHIFGQIEFDQVGQTPKGFRLDLADLAVGAVDALEVGDAHGQEDVIAEGADVVAANVQHLSRGFDSRGYLVSVLLQEKVASFELKEVICGKLI